MSRATRGALWATVTLLGLLMLGRGIWALQQPWRTTGEKLFGLVFFAALTAFATYQLLMIVLPAARWLGAPVTGNVAYGFVSLVFVCGAIFVILDGPRSLSEHWVAVAGTVFFGGSAIVFFVRAWRLHVEQAHGSRRQT